MVITDERDIDNIVFEPPELGCVLSLTGLPGGSATIYDRSPYGNNGTITGATWKRLPSGLWCLEFDGTDDSVDCGNHSSLNITESLTIGLWANYTGLNTWGAIVHKGPGGTPPTSGYGVMQTDTSGQLVFWVGDGSSASSKTLSNFYQLNVWYYIVFVYENGQGGKIYKNGVLIDNTLADIGAIDPSNQPLKIGQNDGWGDYHTGYIALIQIYNRALTALEIQNHFNRERHLFGV